MAAVLGFFDLFVFCESQLMNWEQRLLRVIMQACCSRNSVLDSSPRILVRNLYWSAYTKRVSFCLYVGYRWQENSVQEQAGQGKK